LERLVTKNFVKKKDFKKPPAGGFLNKRQKLKLIQSNRFVNKRGCSV
jgi:hypothetical protein